MAPPRPTVVIIGGGFGGLAAARALAKAPCQVTLIDRRNHHLFQPLLYQVATAGLSGPDIAAPIRQILRRQRNARVLLGEVVEVDRQAKVVLLADGARVPYDALIVAAGSTHSYFGHDDWAEHAPGLKTLKDAYRIRQRVLLAFEQAERTVDLARRRALLSFVVVGGGPTGVELAGAVAEIARYTLKSNFRTIDPADARVILVEGGPRLLGAFSEKSAQVAQRSLERLGVRVMLGAQVTAVEAQGLTLKIGDDVESLEVHTVLWGAGVRGAKIGERLGVPVDRAGRVSLSPQLNLEGDEQVYVIGDLAKVPWPKRGPQAMVPGVAPAAIQMGRFVGAAIQRRWRGQPVAPFEYFDKGSMATVGRKLAVAEIGRLKLSGFMAWMAWLLVHLMSLVGFRNRLVVLTEWAWAYLTWQRSARVVLEDSIESPPDQQRSGDGSLRCCAELAAQRKDTQEAAPKSSSGPRLVA